MIFEPLTINNVTFENRLLRSSVGGRMANYDGTVRDTWRNFELRFANGGVGGIISTTLNINKGRLTPFEYPPMADDHYVAPMRSAIKAVKATGCKYIVQIGDPGYAAQMALFPKVEGSHSSSSGLDLIYGYRNTRIAMTEEQIEQSIQDFANAARRVREAGADGLEITAAKGYIIHQFLNPGLNRRRDKWGGSVDNRFRFLEEIVKAVRKEVGDDFLFGIRLAAEDHNIMPLNLRLPLVFPLKHYIHGNTLEQTLDYGKRLKGLGVDFLHIVWLRLPQPRRHPRRVPGRRAEHLLQRHPPPQLQGRRPLYPGQPAAQLRRQAVVQHRLEIQRRTQPRLRRPLPQRGGPAGDRQRRLPAPGLHRGRVGAWRLRLCIDGPCADRQPRPAQAIPGRQKRTRPPMHPLQPLRRPHRHQPTRLLRPQPLRL